ncbi:MAG: leucine-rich repeat protein [Treponema sp.]|nr:leucine-rich repeat protein [Treponema sp.]
MKDLLRIFVCIIILLVATGVVFAQDRIENGVLFIEEGTVDIAYAKYRRNNEITSVIIPASVKRIGYEAFRECANLVSVEIPSSVSVIDSWAFARCENLKSVKLSNGTTAINEYSFYGCNALSEIYVPGSVSVIGKWAFGKCESLAKVVLGEGVSMIVECAFYGCSKMKSIELPESIIAIGRYFPTQTLIRGVSGSYAQRFAKEKNIPFEIIRFSADYVANAKVLDLAEKNEIADGEYKSFAKLERIIFSNELKKIGKEAFASASLKIVEIPESVSYIGTNAFPRSCVISSKTGSYGEMWAKRNGYKVLNSDVTGINIIFPTQEEISLYMKDNRFWFEKELQGNLFEVEPVLLDGFVSGSLSCDAKNNGLKSLNTIRYIAGLNEVELSNEYGKLAQLAASVNAANGTLTHRPQIISGMSEQTFAEAQKGALESNLAKGQESLPLAILRLTRDAVSNNTKIDSMTHRRWILNPAMSKTGFGIADKVYAQYVMDASNENYLSDVSVIIWPPQNMPLELSTKDDPYSIFFTERFDFSENVKVTMTRIADGNVWNFSDSTTDGYFRKAEGGNNVHKKYIAWKPAKITDYMAGDVVEIIISGIKKDGKDYPIKYNVNYFNALPKDEILNETLNIAKDCKIVSNGKYKNAGGFSSININESLQEIGVESFRNCGDLKKLFVPGNVLKIDAWAFAECTSLEYVEISEGVTSIGEAAFYKCESLKEIILPESLTSLGAYIPKNTVIKCKTGSYAEFVAKRLGLRVENLSIDAK